MLLIVKADVSGNPVPLQIRNPSQVPIGSEISEGACQLRGLFFDPPKVSL